MPKQTTVRLPDDLADQAEAFVHAEAVTGIDARTLTRVSRGDLLDSALQAPQAGFGDTDFYRLSSRRPLFSAFELPGITRSPTLASRLEEMIGRSASSIRPF